MTLTRKINAVLTKRISCYNRRVKKIIVSALKGGVGKTSITVNLGKALLRLGNKVGLLDVDATAPTLDKALGLAESPVWGLDSARAQYIPSLVNGLYILTLASHYGPTPAVMWDEPTLIRAMKELLRDVQWPPLDYLLLDSPPSSSGFMQALYDRIADTLYGVVLVFQPSDIAAADLVRTLNFVKIKKVPLIGLISNMSYCISPSGERFWPFLSPKIELGSVCREHGIPLLGEVPLTSSQQVIDTEFDGIVQRMANLKPVVIKDTVLKKLYRAIAKEALKAVIRRL